MPRLINLKVFTCNKILIFEIQDFRWQQRELARQSSFFESVEQFKARLNYKFYQFPIAVNVPLYQVLIAWMQN